MLTAFCSACEANNKNSVRNDMVSLASHDISDSITEGSYALVVGVYYVPEQVFMMSPDRTPTVELRGRYHF
jgi:hypothetical protein